MKSAHFQHVASDGMPLQTWHWLPDGEPRAALLVIHGMSEHGARYQRLAAALVEEGIAVYALDQRGHGLTAAHTNGLGRLGKAGSWRRMIEDIQELNAVIREQLPNCALYVMGHSMGSFLLQQYIAERGDKIDGAILSATDDDPGPLRLIGLGLMKVETALRGQDHPSALAEALSFSEFNKPFKPARTAFDWLSADEAEVDKYIADPLCGFRCSTGLWAELLAALGDLPKDKIRGAVPDTLPVCLIAGDQDPVAKNGRGPEILAAAYKAHGLKDVSLRIYQQGRHELFNDICRNDVTADLKSWLRRHIGRPI